MSNETQVAGPELPFDWPDVRVSRCLIIRRDRALEMLRSIVRNYNSNKDDSDLLFIEVDDDTFQSMCIAFNRK